MKGYKIGFSEINDDEGLSFVLIKLDIPEDYPGLKIVPSYLNLPTRGLEFRSNVARVLSINKIEMRPELTYNYYTGGGGYAYAFSASDEIMDHAFSIYDNSFYYHPGEIVFPDKFNNTAYIRCTNGIHFFGSQNDALHYINSNWVWHKFNQYKDDMFVKKGTDF